MRASRGSLPYILVIAIAAASCSRSAAPNGSDAAVQPTAFRKALEAAIGQPRSSDALTVFVECRRQHALVSLEAFGNGIAIWNDERQFTLDQESLGTLLQLLQRADFAALDDVYGASAPASAPQEERATIVTCRVKVSIDGQEKESVQFNKGEQSPVLKKLADDLLNVAEPRAASGVAASSLTDGLQKVARGELAPEVCTILIHRKPEEADAPASIGFLMQVDGRTVITQHYDPRSGYGEEVARTIDADEVRRLSGEIAARNPAAWPVNLYAQVYTDLTLEVLNHRVAVQARRFPGMTPGTHGTRQVDFEAVVTALERVKGAKGTGDRHPP